MTSSLANLFILLVLSVNIILSSTQSIQQANIDIPDSQILASDFLSGYNVVAVLIKNLGLRVYQFNQIYNFISDIQTCQGSSISIQEKNNFEQGSQSDKIPSFVIKVNCDDGQKQYQLDLERKEIKDITIKKNIKQELSYMGKITKGSVRLLQNITNSSCTTVTSSNGTYYCGDGNAISGDGCSSTCQVQFCGDAAINNKGTEQCDDGNSVSGDGCFNCKLQCGNGVLNFGEQCDDGNTVSGDGCSQTCRRQTVASAVPLAVGIPVVAAAILGLIFAKCAFAKKAVHAVRGQPAQIMQVEQSTKMMKY